MNEGASYLWAIALLLAAPGPTNALLAAAGAQRGMAAWPALVGVVLGYALAVSGWLVVVAGAAGLHPAVPLIAKLVAVGFLLWSAWKMWRAAGQGGSTAPVDARQVFWTTLLNPKALVFAFALMPAGPVTAQVHSIVALCCLAAIIGLAWLGLGAVLAQRAAGLLSPRRLGRGTAAILALFAGALVVQALG